MSKLIGTVNLEIGTNLDKFEKIFQKYNPEQLAAWREIWIAYKVAPKTQLLSPGFVQS